MSDGGFASWGECGGCELWRWTGVRADGDAPYGMYVLAGLGIMGWCITVGGPLSMYACMKRGVVGVMCVYLFANVSGCRRLFSSSAAPESWRCFCLLATHPLAPRISHAGV